jgi:hypothetical protein
MLYLTFNDAPSGIYFSQVTDACRYLKRDLQVVNVRLVAFISMRSFAKNRALIRAELPDAIVVPMLPTMRLWKFNLLLLCVFPILFDSRKIIARGPYASWMALSLKKIGFSPSVVFDARGAYAAELNEYNVVEDKKVSGGIRELEARVLKESDFRMAVSSKLVNYWKSEYSYNSNAHAIIPCTLNSCFLQPMPEQLALDKLKLALGFGPEDVILAYSGSSAGWQSFVMVDEFLGLLMTENPKLKVLFLAPTLPAEMKSAGRYLGRIRSMWVKPAEVPDLLCICDYGLIIREKSVTNEVASPVKFAEYLSSGLSILISENIGDYSEFVRQKGCGIVIQDIRKPLQIPAILPAEKVRLNKLARMNFSKAAYRASYQKITE